MRERIRCYSISNRRSIGEDLRTRLELAVARENLTTGLYRNSRLKGLSLTKLMERTEKSDSSNSNGQRIRLAPFSTIEERLNGRNLCSSEIVTLLRPFDATPATAEDIKKRSEYELLRARRYINNGSEKMTMGMRIYAVKKGIPLPKAVMHHTR